LAGFGLEGQATTQQQSSNLPNQSEVAAEFDSILFARWTEKENHQQSLNYQKERRRKGKNSGAFPSFEHRESNPGLPATP
jgi:hypothetical protein